MFRIHHTFDAKPQTQDVRQSVALGTGDGIARFRGNINA